MNTLLCGDFLLQRSNAERMDIYDGPNPAVTFVNGDRTTDYYWVDNCVHVQYTDLPNKIDSHEVLICVRGEWDEALGLLRRELSDSERMEIYKEILTDALYLAELVRLLDSQSMHYGEDAALAAGEAWDYLNQGIGTLEDAIRAARRLENE